MSLSFILSISSHGTALNDELLIISVLSRDAFTTWKEIDCLSCNLRLVAFVKILVDAGPGGGNINGSIFFFPLVFQKLKYSNTLTRSPQNSWVRHPSSSHPLNTWNIHLAGISNPRKMTRNYISLCFLF